MYVANGGTFTKSGESIIYGSNANDIAEKNTAATDDNGHAVYVSSGNRKRNSTAGFNVNLDSGTADGWDK